VQKSSFLWSKNELKEKGLRMEEFQNNFFFTTFHHRF
jgi:hypothetical protein